MEAIKKTTSDSTSFYYICKCIFHPQPPPTGHTFTSSFILFMLQSTIFKAIAIKNRKKEKHASRWLGRNFIYVLWWGQLTWSRWNPEQSGLSLCQHQSEGERKACKEKPVWLNPACYSWDTGLKGLATCSRSCGNSEAGSLLTPSIKQPRPLGFPLSVGHTITPPWIQMPGAVLYGMVLKPSARGGLLA